MITVALALPLALWPLQSDDGGFVSGGATGQWSWGAPVVGPVDAGNVWGTNLEGLYLNDAVDTLQIPMPSLSGAADPVLVITHWYRTRPEDVGYVEVDSGTGWEIAEPVYGYPSAAGFSGDSGGWVESAWHLGEFGPSPAVRLVFDSDVFGAAEGWYVAVAGVYDGDAIAPQITPVAVPGNTQDLGGPYVVSMAIQDDHRVADAGVAYVAGGVPGSVPLVRSGTAYHAQIPAQPPDTVVTWQAWASDGDQVATWPPGSDEAFRVFLAAPSDLSAPDGRLIGTSVPLTWTPPDSPHPVVGYQVVEEGVEAEAIEVDVPEAQVPADPDGTWVWSVRALYDVGVTVAGDTSEPLALDLEVPVLEAVEPDGGYPGERLWIEVRGESLYMVTGATELSLHGGITVESVEVLDVGRALARVTIDARATPGPREVQVSGPHGVVAFADAFTVLDGDGAPSVLVVEPGHVVQGVTTTVSVQVSQPFAGAVSVEPGTDLRVTSEVVTDGDIATFDVVALGNAGPGVRTLLLDDGARLWAAPIEVRESVTPLGRGCATGTFPASMSWFAVAALFLRRRRAH